MSRGKKLAKDLERGVLDAMEKDLYMMVNKAQSSERASIMVSSVTTLQNPSKSDVRKSEAFMDVVLRVFYLFSLVSWTLLCSFGFGLLHQTNKMLQLFAGLHKCCHLDLPQFPCREGGEIISDAYFRSFGYVTTKVMAVPCEMDELRGAGVFFRLSSVVTRAIVLSQHARGSHHACR